MALLSILYLTSFNLKILDLTFFFLFSAATIVSISAGISIAWPSPSIPQLIADDYHFNITREEASYIAIITALGNVCGGPISAILVDLIGRKYAIISIAVPQTLSFLLIYFDKFSILLLYLARFLGGMGEGATFSIMAIYIAEISEPSIRGTLGSYVSLTLRIGMMLINIIGAYLSISLTSLVCLIFPLAFFLSFVWMPESPYYLIMKDRKEEAEKALKFLRQKKNVKEELNSISCDVRRQISESGTFKDLLSISSNRKGCVIILGLRTIQQLSGISAFTMYTQLLFKDAVDHLSPSTSAIIFSSIQFFITFVSSILVDITGRKPLLIFSCISCFFVLIAEGIYFTLRDFTQVNVDDFRWLPLTGMIIFIVVFSVGLGSIVNLLLGELFSASVKAKALCIMNIYFAIIMSLTTKFFQVMADWKGLSIPFYVFSVCCGLGAVFCYYCVPETKGKTLEEIQQHLKGNRQYKSSISS